MNISIFSRRRRQRDEAFRELNTLLVKCNEVLTKNSRSENWKIIGRCILKGIKYVLMGIGLGLIAGSILFMGLFL